MFHMTRKLIGEESLAEVEKSPGDSKMVQGCLADIEDGLWQGFIEPEDLELTWESWREICKKHNYQGMTKEISTNLRSILENDEVSEEKKGELVRTERELLEGNITLQDIEITPEEWTSLCEKYNRHSIYIFHCVPKLFGNPTHNEKHKIDEDYSMDLHLSGKIETENGSPKCSFNIIAHLIKTASGEKHLLMEGTIKNKGGAVPSPDDMAKAAIENIFLEAAQIVIQTRNFKAQVLQ